MTQSSWGDEYRRQESNRREQEIAKQRAQASFDDRAARRRKVISEEIAKFLVLMNRANKRGPVLFYRQKRNFDEYYAVKGRLRGWVVYAGQDSECSDRSVGVTEGGLYLSYVRGHNSRRYLYDTDHVNDFRNSIGLDLFPESIMEGLVKCLRESGVAL